MLKEEIQAQIKVIIQIIQQGMYPREWRKGQAVFNLFYINFPEQCNKLRGSDKDCFYNDNKVELFINSVEEQLKSAKSIQDIEREAFEAGRSSQYIMYDYDFDYETFEDYLKSKDGTTS